MTRVYYKKVPLWGIIKRIVSPKLNSPGFPVKADTGNPFILSESFDNVEFIEGGTWDDVLKNVIPYIKYAWHSGQLKMTTKFMIVGLIGLIINVLIVRFTIGIGVDSKIAGIIGTVVTIFTNFLINDHWTFSEHRSNRPWVHRLIGYYGASLGTMIIQIIVYEGVVILGFSPTLAVIVSVALSYILRLIYIRDKVYNYS